MLISRAGGRKDIRTGASRVAGLHVAYNSVLHAFRLSTPGAFLLDVQGYFDAGVPDGGRTPRLVAGTNSRGKQ
jgi:hypothetical protein